MLFLFSNLKMRYFSQRLANKWSQCANGESNKIVLDKKKTVTAWIFNTYRVRNHFVPNPINSKLIKLNKNFKKIKKQKSEHRQSQKKWEICMVQYWELPADWSISASLSQLTTVLCSIILSKKQWLSHFIFFQFLIFLILDL